MKTVYRYEIPANVKFTLNMPKGARLLAAKAGGRAMFVWALVDRELPHDEVRRFLLVLVGQPIPDGLDLAFVGILSPEKFISSILLFEIKNDATIQHGSFP